MDIAIIPAYNPDMKLVELTKELQKSIEKIIVVNDVVRKFNEGTLQGDIKFDGYTAIKE